MAIMETRKKRRSGGVQNNLEIPTTDALIAQEDYYWNYWVMDFCIFYKDFDLISWIQPTTMW